MEKDEKLDCEIRAKMARTAMWVCFALFVTVSVVFGCGILQIAMIPVCALSIIMFIRTRADLCKEKADENFVSNPSGNEAFGKTEGNKK